MNLIKIWIRDKLRGYTDKDIQSLTQKYKDYKPRPGGIIELTRAEYKVSLGEGITYRSTLKKNSLLLRSD